MPRKRKNTRRLTSEKRVRPRGLSPAGVSKTGLHQHVDHLKAKIRKSVGCMTAEMLHEAHKWALSPHIVLQSRKLLFQFMRSHELISPDGIPHNPQLLRDEICKAATRLAATRRPPAGPPPAIVKPR